MAHIFISYAKKDTRDLALQLREALTTIPGLTAWMDVSLETGESWAAQIEEEIDKADLVVVLLSPDVNRKGRRSFVLNEIDYAQQEHKPIIPVMAQPARVPVQLAGVQYINLTGDRDAALRALVSSIARRVGVRPPPEPTAPVNSAPSASVRQRPSFRPVVTAIAGLALVALIAAVALLSSLSPQTNTVTPTTAVALLGTATDAPTHTPTITPIPSDTPTELPIELIVGTLDAQATIEQAALNAESTAAARATEYAVGTQNVIDQTATATLWTATPTANITASIEAYRTQQAATATAQHRADLTATATLWTATPTVTPTPTATRTPSATPTLSAEQLASTPIPNNAAWTPVERDFDGVTMVLVPAGCFMMGSDAEGYDYTTQGVPDGGEQCFDAPFWIDKFEVTQAQFARFGGVANRESSFSGEQRPVEQITWIEARDFCALRDARLPSEREWEYAARGPDGLKYPWGDEWDETRAVWDGNSNNQTAEVGSRPAGASWVGALDMSGNVWEWVGSAYANYPYVAGDGREDVNRTEGLSFLRGGSWYNSNSDLLRAASRSRLTTGLGYDNLGFRCVLS